MMINRGLSFPTHYRARTLVHSFCKPFARRSMTSGSGLVTFGHRLFAINSPSKDERSWRSSFGNTYAFRPSVILCATGLLMTGGLFRHDLSCQDAALHHVQSDRNMGLPVPAPSNINVRELSFGTATGLCAGIFIKKGFRAIAFLLGGAFVFLQYLRFQDLATVHWGAIASKLNFGSEGGSIDIQSAWSRLVSFLTNDFQQRASFLAGLALGLRMG